MMAAAPSAGVPLRWRAALRRGAAAALCCCATAAAAQMPASAPSGPAVAQTIGDVRAFLLRIHEAASLRSYHGTFVVSGGGTISSARIAHYCDGRDQFERIESLDGERRQLLRHNDTVHVVWPASRTVQVERREPVKSFPALLQDGDDRVADFYQAFREGADRVAGRDAEVVRVQPRDRWRFGYRLWADRATGLLLRADVLGERQAVLETAAFSEVTLGVRPQPEVVLAAMRKSEAARVLRPERVPTTLDAEGWELRNPVPGFRLVSCLKRQLDAAERPREGNVVQAVFSDGLTHVSIFVEPFDAARHARALVTSVGATQTLMRRHGDAWITVVGDVPLPTLRQFAAGLERRR